MLFVYMQYFSSLVSLGFTSFIIYYWYKLYRKRVRKRFKQFTKAANPFSAALPGSDNAGNVVGKNNTVHHYHAPSRELTEMERSLKETIDILAGQLIFKQKNIEDLQKQCAYKEEWVRHWKEKFEQLEQARRQQKKKRKARSLLPLYEVELKEKVA